MVKLRTPRTRLTPDQRAEALRQLKAGGLIKSVAEGLGVSRDTVRKIKNAEIRTGDAVTSAAQPVAARVSPAELQAFDAAIDRAGLRSRSDGLRALVRMASGFLELSCEENAQLDDLTRELGKVGVNINQLARLANSGRLPLNGRQFDELAELGRGIRQLRSFLGQMNTERRRRGTALFEKHRETQEHETAHG